MWKVEAAENFGKNGESLGFCAMIVNGNGARRWGYDGVPNQMPLDATPQAAIERHSEKGVAKGRTPACVMAQEQKYEKLLKHL